MTVHSLEFGADYDHQVIAGCTGCGWEQHIYQDARGAYLEFNGHLAWKFHPAHAEADERAREEALDAEFMDQETP